MHLLTDIGKVSPVELLLSTLAFQPLLRILFPFAEFITSRHPWSVSCYSAPFGPSGFLAEALLLLLLGLLMLVALYAPVIDHKRLFCSVVSLAAGPRPSVFVPFGKCHTEAPYTIAGRTTGV